MSYVIVTDSAANLPEEIYEQFNITVLSLSFHVDGKEYTSGTSSSGAAVEANVSESSGHSGGEKPDGEPPSGGKPDGEPPSGGKPDGEPPSGGKPGSE